jgi:hypothetical protein
VRPSLNPGTTKKEKIKKKERNLKSADVVQPSFFADKINPIWVK